MIKKRKLDKSHVLVIGSGPSTRKYWDKIENFIKEYNPITFGCNHIMDFLVPDYHFWGSRIRWEKYGHLVDPNTRLIVSIHFPKKYLKPIWKGKIWRFKNIEYSWKEGSEIKNSPQYNKCKVYVDKNDYMRGCFRDICSNSIFYAYIKGAKRISVVGNDGYTMYDEKDLKTEKEAQHCYGKGYTDGFTYNYGRKKDIDKYRSLKLLCKYGKKKYGFKFEIITPTIYDKFYNQKILGIEERHKDKEPSVREYKKTGWVFNRSRWLKDREY